MAIRTTIAKRVFKHLLPTTGSITHSPFISPSSQKSSTATIPSIHHHRLTSPDSTVDTGIFTRHLDQSRTGLFYIPVGEKLRENLNISELGSGGLSVHDARKIMRCSQLKNVRSALKVIAKNSITYNEFVAICVDVCDNRDQGLEFAKLLDVAGDVIVVGDIVFIRPGQVAKSLEKVISLSIEIPNDQRKQELEELERQKGLIDQQAISRVRCELYCGFGLLILQTLGFMRLTFWELSWDVMEPICFFVTSFYFLFAYVFFLRTSEEPSFEGYFQQRFRVKQRKLMRVHTFDYKRYKELCNIVYPSCEGCKY